MHATYQHLLVRVQALEDERLGPRKPGVQSPERRMRLAVQEAATSLACTLMPSIEPVVSVSLCCQSLCSASMHTPCPASYLIIQQAWVGT